MESRGILLRDHPTSLQPNLYADKVCLKIYFHTNILQKCCCGTYFLVSMLSRSQDRTVSIATRLWVTQSWIQFPTAAAARNFSPLQSLKTSSRTHLASYAMGTRDLKLGVKQSGCVADHSPPPSAMVKWWSNTSGPSMYCHGMQRAYFTFTLVY